MGCCSSTQDLTPQEKEERAVQRRQNNALDKVLEKEKTEDSAVKKLLLLGAGESGKSTLFKQMIQIYGKGFPEDERKTYRNIVYSNTWTAIRTLVKYSDFFPDEQCHIAPHNQVSKTFVIEAKNDMLIDDEVARHISTLWHDEGIQHTYEMRSQFQLSDNARYFLDKVMEIGTPDYVPTEQDVLHTRVRTTGIVEMAFEVDKNTFKMYDVGGQRNERKKWIHCFENVTAVLFVAAISEYDQVLYEDETTSRMYEALNLFDEICNLKWFKSTSMILFLNKRDLFADKFSRVGALEAFKKCFPDYQAGQDYQEACDYVTEQFRAKNKSPQEKEVYAHVTCATDTENIRVVFSAVKDIVIRSSLKEGGLM